MLDAFASVGAARFDVTLTDAAGGKVAFRAEQLHNVIVRPRPATGVTLIQLDDLGEDAARRLGPVSFLVLCTSPGNYQAWVAVADADADFARRLRIGSGADPMASGATRVSGSLNIKQKYAPSYPRVETVRINPGKVLTRAELEALGLVAAPPRQVPPESRAPSRRAAPAAWPSYQRCLQNAPPAREGDRPDVSRADFTFCLIAIDWGWSVEDTARRLMEESRKAEENGEAYAFRTAQKAAEAIARRGERRDVTPPVARANEAVPVPAEALPADTQATAGEAQAHRIAIPKAWAQAGVKRGSQIGTPEPRRRQQGDRHRQVFSEDVVAIGEGRYAHFRRSRRYNQVQVAFSAPEGIDPNPGREITSQLEELGWKWRPADPGQPWTYQLEKPTSEDATARGDSRDVLHEQFLDIILEYREKHGMPPLVGALGWSR